MGYEASFPCYLLATLYPRTLDFLFPFITYPLLLPPSPPPPLPSLPPPTRPSPPRPHTATNPPPPLRPSPSSSSSYSSPSISSSPKKRLTAAALRRHDGSSHQALKTWGTTPHNHEKVAMGIATDRKVDKEAMTKEERRKFEKFEKSVGNGKGGK